MYQSEAQYVIFTDDATKRYEDFTIEDLTSQDDNIGIKYENTEIVEDTLLLLRYNCPDPACEVACLGWPDLHRHVKSVHHKKMCDLCTRNKKVFTHEHELYTDKDLHRHMAQGDDNPGAIDQSGFKGHPLCQFCRERFYGDDELYVHCRSKHERCFVCDERDRAQDKPRSNTYYMNYETLSVHFRKDHFMCGERDCLEKRFVVFGSEIDFKAHQLAEHRNTLSKDVRRDARMVDISGFDYRAPYQEDRRRGGGGPSGTQREGRGRGRGRDPNADAIPPSSAQPLNRAEQAFQRQMAIHSAQSVSNRTFGGQLTSDPTPAQARVPRGTREPPTVTAPRPANHVDQPTSSLSSLSVAAEAPAQTPQEAARRLRHAAVIERSNILLGNDAIKSAQFRSALSSYRSNAIRAPALIDTFFALFSDTTPAALGTLIREIADIYEDKSKADAILKAWNDWRAINEDYPSLPGPSGLSGSSLPLGWATTKSHSTSTGSTGTSKSASRVLKLKSSTAQSSRSQVSRTGSWGSASAGSSTRAGGAFPGLPPSATVLPNRTGTGKVTTQPWVAASSSTPTSTPPVSRPASRAPTAGRKGGVGGDAFPALPAAPKPTSTIFGYGRGMVRRDGFGGNAPSNFSWGGASGESSEGASAAASESEGQGGNGKRKGNKGKKQVLVAWG